MQLSESVTRFGDLQVMRSNGLEVIIQENSLLDSIGQYAYLRYGYAVDRLAVGMQ